MQFHLRFLFDRVCFRPANAIFVKPQTRFAGRDFAGSAKVAGSRYPTLRTIARDVFAIRLTTIAPE